MFAQNITFDPNVLTKGTAVRLNWNNSRGENALVLSSNEAEIALVTAGDLVSPGRRQMVTLNQVRQGEVVVSLLDVSQTQGLPDFTVPLGKG